MNQLMKKLSYLFFGLSVFSTYFQFLSDSLNVLISPAMIVAIVFAALSQSFHKEDFKFFLIFAVFFTANLLVSVLVYDNEIGAAMRFYVILLMILFAVILKFDKTYVDIFLVLSALFVLMLLYLEIHYITHPNKWVVDRMLWMKREIGDVYTLNGWVYKIQIKGNSLLPLAFFLSYFVSKKKYYSLYFLGGTLIAGNMMFLVAMLAFFFLAKIFIEKKRNSKYSIIETLFLYVVPFAFIVAYMYFVKLIVLKMDVSLPTRLDQVIVLMKDYMTNFLSIITGRGLGNVLENVSTQYRNYSGSMYYELQTVYIINQIGFLLFSIFLLIFGIIVRKNWRSKQAYVFFLSYLIYAVTNPYIFDVTNLAALILVSGLDQWMSEKRREPANELLDNYGVVPSRFNFSRKKYRNATSKSSY